MSVMIKPKLDLASLILTPEEAQIMSRCTKLSSEVWTGIIDGQIVCVWGVAPPSLLSEQAYLWLYTNDMIKGHEFVFVRHSQRVIEDLLKRFKLIVGVCSLEAKQSIRWLKFLGAKFGESEDGKYIPFQIRKK